MTIKEEEPLSTKDVHKKIRKEVYKETYDSGFIDVNEVIKRTIKKCQDAQDEQVEEFCAKLSEVLKDISKLNLMIYERATDSEQVKNLSSGINNSLKVVADLLKDKIFKKEEKCQSKKRTLLKKSVHGKR